MQKITVLEFLNSLKLVSCKIWVTEKSLKIHTPCILMKIIFIMNFRENSSWQLRGFKNWYDDFWCPSLAQHSVEKLEIFREISSFTKGYDFYKIFTKKSVRANFCISTFQKVSQISLLCSTSNTVWKFEDFSSTSILREIKCSTSSWS